MPGVKQLIQAVFGLLLLAVFLYVAAHLLVVAIFIGIGAVAVFYIRKLLIEQGIMNNPADSPEYDSAPSSGKVIEGDYEEVDKGD